MTLKMTTAQVVETSVTVTNSSFQNYTHPDDHTTRTTDTPGFKPFTTKGDVALMYIYQETNYVNELQIYSIQNKSSSVRSSLASVCT